MGGGVGWKLSCACISVGSSHCTSGTTRILCCVAVAMQLSAGSGDHDEGASSGQVQNVGMDLASSGGEVPNVMGSPTIECFTDLEDDDQGVSSGGVVQEPTEEKKGGAH